jgi:hypothetical protein
MRAFRHARSFTRNLPWSPGQLQSLIFVESVKVGAIERSFERRQRDLEFRSVLRELSLSRKALVVMPMRSAADAYQGSPLLAFSPTIPDFGLPRLIFRSPGFLAFM